MSAEGSKHKKNNRNFKKNKVKYEKPTKKSEIEENEIQNLKSTYEKFKPIDIKSFKDFPISKNTLNGLKDGGFETPTDIQKEAIIPALQGKDILGAAITGSGKTLAFLIPILECLYLKKWTKLDGLGAIIISPTRELAYQIFETLKKIGHHHEFSAALVIGGKNLKFERRRMDQCNIVICTPGRLLQHMDENPLFNCVSMQILVLDEADRILDLGFEETMNAIIENFPPDRQTLLFSATQTKSVKDLARLSLTSPVTVAPHSQELTTPVNLNQNYVVIELEEKITMLWSFIKNHLKQKIIVFMSSCKQVKFVTEMFTKLRAGTLVLGLYGTLHQDRRVAIYEEFMRKTNAVLICTDVASRGLDFPVVNWVIQLDCPEDSTAYIHRAGRTARHKARGESLLVLLPSEEEAMVAELKDRKIPIKQIFIDMKRMFSPRAKMEGYLAQNSELKATAQRAFVAYIKSVALMKNKKLFNVEAINFDAYAKSLGLLVTPRVRFVERQRKKIGLSKNNNQGDSDDVSSDIEYDKEKEQQKGSFTFNEDDESDADDSLFKVKRRDHDIVSDDDHEEVNENDASDEILEKPISKKKLKHVTKAAAAKKVLKKKIQANKKVQYDDDGNEILDPTKQKISEFAKEYDNDDEEDGGGIDIEKARKMLKEEDQYDKQRFKERVKARHKEKKRKLKEKKMKDDEDQDQDDFGDSNDDDEGPDLSWLPDPDKIYDGKSNLSDNDNSDTEINFNANSESSDTDDEIDEKFHRLPKKLIAMKRKSENNVHEEIVKTKKFKPKRIPTGTLSVNEAETLAMKLLGV